MYIYIYTYIYVWNQHKYVFEIHTDLLNAHIHSAAASSHSPWNKRENVCDTSSSRLPQLTEQT